jgi:sucrose phosphorylase
MRGLSNSVQLITYPDSLGGNLQALRNTLSTYFDGAVSGVHILPFYPSSADRGFAPLTHNEVDPSFGSWEDIRKIAEDYQLLADLTVNHLSCESQYFKDFLENGEESSYRELFLDIDRLLAENRTTIESLSQTYRPRDTQPICEFKMHNGDTKRIWCTFTNSQVDLDLTKPVTRELITEFIHTLADNGAKCIRLDAVGYTIKRPHTNSFLIPETYELIRWMAQIAHARNVEILAEIHHDYKKQTSLLKAGVDWIYDFSLPVLVLNALYTGGTNNLKNWIRIRPKKTLTTLDTHDGIGIIDVDGLITPREVEETVQQIHSRGGSNTFRASGNNSSNVDIYQVNCTYYSALGENDDAYIAARAIQFFVPGIPQVYYVGSLAGRNDVELLDRTGHGRDINRHNYTPEEIEAEFERNVVKRLLELMRFRNTYPAFRGEFTMVASDVDEVVLRWDYGDLYAEARINVRTFSVEVEYVDRETMRCDIRHF